MVGVARDRGPSSTTRGGRHGVAKAMERENAVFVPPEPAAAQIGVRAAAATAALTAAPRPGWCQRLPVAP